MKIIKTYSIPIWFWIIPIAMPFFAFIYWFQHNDIGPTIVIVAMCLLFWYVMLSSPIKIHILANNSVVFQSVINSKIINISDILAIEKGSKTTKIKHKNGKIELSNIMTDIEDFFQYLQKSNPSITEDVDELTKFSRSPGKVFLLIFVLIIVAISIVILAIKVPAVGKFFH